MTTTASANGTSKVAPQIGAAVNADGAAQRDAQESPLSAFVREKRLLPGQVFYGRMILDGQEVAYAFTRPLTHDQAVANRVRARRGATGYLGLATTPVSEPTLPIGDGVTVKLTVSCEDNTPEGKLARQQAAEKRAQETRGKEVRRMMTNFALSWAEAAAAYDQTHFTPGVTVVGKPAPETVATVKAGVAPELGDLTGQPEPPLEVRRQSYVESVRNDIRQGRYDVAEGTKRIREWDANSLA
jgi:hypothetical protein